MRQMSDPESVRNFDNKNFDKFFYLIYSLSSLSLLLSVQRNRKFTKQYPKYLMIY